MKNILLYSRRAYADGFILILLVHEIAESDRILLYRNTVMKSKCIISIQDNQLIFEHLSEVTGQRIAKVLLNYNNIKKIIICASWNKKENFLGAILNDDLVLKIIEDQPYKVRFDIHGIPSIIHNDVIVFIEKCLMKEKSRAKAQWNRGMQYYMK